MYFSKKAQVRRGETHLVRYKVTGHLVPCHDVNYYMRELKKEFANPEGDLGFKKQVNV